MPCPPIAEAGARLMGVPHPHCRPAANETVILLLRRRHRGRFILGATTPRKSWTGILEHLSLSPRSTIPKVPGWDPHADGAVRRGTWKSYIRLLRSRRDGLAVAALDNLTPVLASRALWQATRTALAGFAMHDCINDYSRKPFERVLLPTSPR